MPCGVGLPGRRVTPAAGVPLLYVNTVLVAHGYAQGSKSCMP